jgi:hypothetical protein
VLPLSVLEVGNFVIGFDVRLRFSTGTRTKEKKREE